jgi:hypothetical protein
VGVGVMPAGAVADAAFDEGLDEGPVLAELAEPPGAMEVDVTAGERLFDLPIREAGEQVATEAKVRRGVAVQIGESEHGRGHGRLQGPAARGSSMPRTVHVTPVVCTGAWSDLDEAGAGEALGFNGLLQVLRDDESDVPSPGAEDSHVTYLGRVDV